MHHAAAGNLQPILAHLLYQRTGKIDLKARLGVAEIMRTKTDLYVVSHQLFKDEFNRALQVADRDVLVHVEAFNLVEGWIMRGIGVVSSINPARHHNPN